MSTTETKQKRSMSFYAQRAVERYLGPELRTFAQQLVDGDPLADDAARLIASKLQQVRANAQRHGKVNAVTEIETVVPAPAVTSGIPRLPRAVIDEILTLRRQGQSKRAIARTLKRPNATIQAVLKREGDPAPQELLQRDASVKAKTVSRLLEQLREMGVQVNAGVTEGE